MRWLLGPFSQSHASDLADERGSELNLLAVCQLAVEVKHVGEGLEAVRQRGGKPPERLLAAGPPSLPDAAAAWARR